MYKICVAGHEKHSYYREDTMNKALYALDAPPSERACLPGQ